MAIDKNKQSIKSLIHTKNLIHIKTKKNPTTTTKQHHPQEDEEGQGDSERNPSTQGNGWRMERRGKKTQKD
jgi:hypothetical protein